MIVLASEGWKEVEEVEEAEAPAEMLLVAFLASSKLSKPSKLFLASF